MHHCIENPTSPQASKALKTSNTGEHPRRCFCSLSTETTTSPMKKQEPDLGLSGAHGAIGNGARIFELQAISSILEPPGSALQDQHKWFVQLPQRASRLLIRRNYVHSIKGSLLGDSRQPCYLLPLSTHLQQVPRLCPSDANTTQRKQYNSAGPKRRKRCS
jgi:hypothetical protein